VNPVRPDGVNPVRPGGVSATGVSTAWFDAPGGGRLQLWPQKAAFDPDLGLLLVADAHLGKAVSFRRLGVPVPEATTAEALARLDALMAATDARHLVFLGDLLHSARAHAAGTMAAVAAWRARHAGIDLTLVRGNHDAHAGDPPPTLGVRVVDGPLRIGPWAMLHQPGEVDGAYALAGHLHPGVVLGGRANDRLRLPCFHFGPRCGVLPAFGPFTGLHVLPAAPGVQRWAVADGGVHRLPSPGD
jgi:DNA ligase-associated metallophosphoesterase